MVLLAVLLLLLLLLVVAVEMFGVCVSVLLIVFDGFASVFI